MGLYSRYVLPRMLDFACRNKDVSELRKQVLPSARGIVVEVGIGSALNLPYYSPSIEHLYGIDLSPELLQMERRKTERAHLSPLFPMSANGDMGLDRIGRSPRKISDSPPI
jgi:hypothetical protein